MIRDLWDYAAYQLGMGIGTIAGTAVLPLTGALLVSLVIPHRWRVLRSVLCIFAATAFSAIWIFNDQASLFVKATALFFAVPVAGLIGYFGKKSDGSQSTGTGRWRHGS